MVKDKKINNLLRGLVIAKRVQGILLSATYPKKNNRRVKHYSIFKNKP